MIKKTKTSSSRTSKKASSAVHSRRPTRALAVHEAPEKEAAILSTNSGDSSDSPDGTMTQAKGGASAYRYFMPAARALPAESIVTARVDVRYLYVNVSRGVAAVLHQRARIERELPGVNLAEIEELPSLASAVFYSASQIVAEAPADPKLNAVVARNRTLRNKLLLLADVYAMKGVFDSALVKQIHRGRGQFDAASDTMALAELFRSHAAEVLPHGFVTEAEIDEAGSVGNELLNMLKPTEVRPLAADASTSITVEARDRLFTLLKQRYDDARRVGMWLFGRDVNKYMPTLASRRVAPKAAAEPPPATATTASGTTTTTPATKEAPAS